MSVAQRLTIFGLLISMVATACAPGPGAASGSQNPLSAAAPTRIVTAIMGDPHTVSEYLNPASLVAGIRELDRLLHAGLTYKDDQGATQAQLAAAVPTLENGLWTVAPDGRMETVWKLRADARWHDGAPLTSADLAFTGKLSHDRSLAFFRAQILDLVVGFEETDPATLTIRWRAPHVEADGVFPRPLPKHILDKLYTEEPELLKDHPYWTSEFVGAGPFKLKEWVRGSYVVLAAFDQYVLGRPKVDEVEVRFILDPNVMIANLMAGSLGMSLGRGISFDQAIETRHRWKDGAVELKDSSWIAVYPQLLTPNPPVIGDLQFRRALLQAIDRQGMVDSIQHGLVEIAHSFVAPSAPEYQEIQASIVRHEFDSRSAAQLLEGLGFTKGPDGGLRDAAGQKLGVELRAIAGYDIHIKSQLAVADYWQRLGLGVGNTVVPTQRVADREYLATMPGFEVRRQGNTVSSSTLDNLYSSKAPVSENNFVGNNIPRYRNPEYDALHDRFLATIPLAERMLVLHNLVRHVTEQLPWMGLYFDAEPVLIGNRVKKVNSGNQSSMTWNAQDWEVRN